MRKFLFVFLFIIASCQANKTNQSFVFDYYENGLIKSQSNFSNGKENGFRISYYDNGGIKSVLHFYNGLQDGEQVFFYPNGFVKEKFISKNDQKNGFWYFYYPSGAMKNSRYCMNGMEVYLGADYWDDTLNLIKSTLHFNDRGQVFQKKNFDIDGHFVNDEKASFSK